ncbi:MAG: DUF1501 domain-containing protein [Pirellulales bacterium]
MSAARHRTTRFVAQQQGVSRRALLEAGGRGLLGVGLAPLAAAAMAGKLGAGELRPQRDPAGLTAGAPANSKHTRPPLAPRAKSVIFLYQFGGPSHVDLLDRKPQAPDQVRGPLAGIATTLAGVETCEQLPRLARVLDKVTLVRSVHHGFKNHNPASYYALSGHAPPVDDIRLRESLDLYPAYGSVVDRLAPAARDLPTFVSYPHVIRDGENTPGQWASFLGHRHDPLFFRADPNAPDFRLPELSLPEGISPGRLADRRQLQALIDGQTRLRETLAGAGLGDQYDRAVELIGSARVREAFNLAAEPDKVREQYGRTTYGQGCLLARRLVEAGVRFVNVYFSPNIGGQSYTSGGWDTHGFNNTRMYPILKAWQLPITDQTLPTLLIDLDERGLLDETLVVWMGEFGRTPTINKSAGRDHWPSCYTVLLAGGGLKRGYVHGASDRDGATPDLDPVRPDDLAATIYWLLGIDPASEVLGPNERPLRISGGEVIWPIVA